MTDKEQIAATHETVRLMFPMVQKLHDTMFVGNGKESYSTQISKNTEMRQTINKRIWALTISFIGGAVYVFWRWAADRLKGQ